MRSFCALNEGPRRWARLGAIGIAAIPVVMASGCVTFTNVGPGGKRLMQLHYAQETKKIVAAMRNHTAASPSPEQPPVSPGPTGAPSEKPRLLGGDGPAPGQSEPLPVDVQPGFGSLVIKTQPAGAACKVGEDTIGTSPCTAERLEPGRYDLELALPYYKPLSATVSIEAGEETAVAFSLTPEAVPVTIETTPKTAHIVVDGLEVESGHAVKLSAGEYELTTVLDGFEDIHRPLVVSDGSPVNLELDLVPGYSGPQLESRRGRLISGIVFGGLAAVAAGIFAWQAVEAESALTRLQSSTAPSVDTQASLEAGKSAAMVADISLGSASLCAALATGLLLSLAF